MILKVIAFILAAVSLTHGVTIQCGFNHVDWSIVKIQYTCFPATIISDGNLTHVIDVTGSHNSGKSNADVKALFIKSTHQHLNRIPKGIEKFFSNLLVFLWEEGNLTTLTADDLKPFPELQEFYFWRNKLASLEGDLFKYTPKLRLISAGENPFEHVGYGLLDGLNNLTEARFEYNPCINMKATSPVEIQELKLKLQNQCPPLRQCSIECVELVETLEEEVKRQSEEIVRHREENLSQNEKIAAQAEKTMRQTEANLRQDEKIAAQVNEIARQGEANLSQEWKINAQAKEIAAQANEITEMGDAIRELKNFKLKLQNQALEVTTTTSSTSTSLEHSSIACVKLIETFKESQRVLDERQDRNIGKLQEKCMISI